MNITPYLASLAWFPPSAVSLTAENKWTTKDNTLYIRHNNEKVEGIVVEIKESLYSVSRTATANSTVITSGPSCIEFQIIDHKDRKRKGWKEEETKKVCSYKVHTVNFEVDLSWLIKSGKVAVRIKRVVTIMEAHLKEIIIHIRGRK